MKVNPLSTNPTKWSNTVNQFLDHFVGLALKGLTGAFQLILAASLRSYQLSMMKLFRESFLQVVNYFANCLKAPSQMFDSVLNTSLVNNIEAISYIDPLHVIKIIKSSRKVLNCCLLNQQFAYLVKGTIKCPCNYKFSLLKNILIILIYKIPQILSW